MALEIAVRGGGHNAAGLAVVDDGLVIDLTEMNQVQVDPERRIARAGGGATWGDFDAATQAHGLATTGGAISMTGIGGLTLGGGLGYLMRSRGLACDNLIGAEVVLADGSVVRTSETERPEFLWGLRGGGGNFGVVTEFEYRLTPLDGMYAGLLIYPRERAVEALGTYREQTASAPDELATFCGLLEHVRTAPRSSRSSRPTPAMPPRVRPPSPGIAPWASRSPTWLGPCPTSRSSRCWMRGFNQARTPTGDPIS